VVLILASVSAREAVPTASRDVESGCANVSGGVGGRMSKWLHSFPRCACVRVRVRVRAPLMKDNYSGCIGEHRRLHNELG
jgi:hypothetical protein